MQIIAIIISILSIIIVVITLFLTHLRPPKIICRIGTSINIYYADYAVGGSLGIILPVTFINTAARSGTIFRTAIILYLDDKPHERYYMHWRGFLNLELQQDKWRNSEIAHPLVVSGKSTATKHIWFMWSAYSKPKLEVHEGTYNMIFCYWTRLDHDPVQENHKFHVNNVILNELKEYRLRSESTIVDIVLDRESGRNRFMTENESNKLLGG